MRLACAVCAVLAVFFLGGCAHPMVISPDLGKIERDAVTARISSKVGYYISDAQRASEVTTPGGGGDKVSYHPYRDTETAFYKMLTNTFESVTQLKSASDSEEINRNALVFVITPDLVTNSSSPSPFTWPPTEFSMELTCTVVDLTGKTILTQKVTGKGKAEFSEFKSDFSLSGKLAAQDALIKMQQALLAAPELRN